VVGQQHPYDTASHLRELGRLIRMMGGRSPDVTFFHTGVWDLANEWGTVTEYGRHPDVPWFTSGFVSRWQRAVDNKLRLLQHLLPTTLLFHRSNGPIKPRLLRSGVLQTRLRPEYVFRLAAAAGEIGTPGVCFLDFYGTMLGLPDSASRDGLHYRGEVMLTEYLVPILNSVFQAGDF
jgi:hypothetical protein